MLVVVHGTPGAPGHHEPVRSTGDLGTLASSEPIVPAYGGACIAGVARGVLDALEGGAPPAWLPAPLMRARQVVLLILDGLGWDQLRARRSLAPSMGAMEGGPVTSVAPTTTATALTSITTGLPPAAHGLLGYRVRVDDGDVLNVLRWRTAAGDARETLVPEEFQPVASFGGRAVPVVSRSYFAGSGFTRAFLQGAVHVGWRMPSTMRVEVSRLLAEGAPFVVAYYDGIDVVAHERGFGDHYDSELVAADRLVGDLAHALPPGAALAVTSDHGQVEVRREPVVLDPELLADVEMMSGEARFRWLHAAPGAAERLAETIAERYGSLAWVRRRDEVVAEGWLGGDPAGAAAGRIGDVAVAAREPVAFFDPQDVGESRLVCRHGSLTRAEMLVPLLAWSA